MQFYSDDFADGQGDVIVACRYLNEMGHHAVTGFSVDSHLLRTCSAVLADKLSQTPGNPVIYADISPSVLVLVLRFVYGGYRGPAGHALTVSDYHSIMAFTTVYNSPWSFRSLVNACINANAAQIVRQLGHNPTREAMISTVLLAHESRSERLWAALIKQTAEQSLGGWQVMRNPFEEVGRDHLDLLGHSAWSLLVLVARVGAFCVNMWDVRVKYLDDGRVKVVSKDGSVDITHEFPGTLVG